MQLSILLLIYLLTLIGHIFHSQMLFTWYELMKYDGTLGSVHLKSVGGAGKQGGGACKFRIGFGGGPSKFRIGFGGGHVNSAYVEKSL